MTLSDLEKKTGKEVIMRSCCKCNSAHKHLKKTDFILYCIECGKLYYKGQVLNEKIINELVGNTNDKGSEDE